MAIEFVQRIQVGVGGASSIEFTGIPQDGVDLLLQLSLRTDASTAGDGVDMRFNGDSGSSYPVVEVRGENTTVTSTSATGTSISSVANGDTAASDSFASTSVFIANYTESQNKTVSVDTVSTDNGPDTNRRIRAAEWTDTNAITSIEFTCSPQEFVQYSSISLYKITAV